MYVIQQSAPGGWVDTGLEHPQKDRCIRQAKSLGRQNTHDYRVVDTSSKAREIVYTTVGDLSV